MELHLLFFHCSIECHINICDFHREQAWERWLSKGSNGLSDKKEQILAKLRAIAQARTHLQCEKAIENVKSSAEWKEHQHFRNWIGNTWLKHVKVGTALCHNIHRK